MPLRLVGCLLVLILAACDQSDVAERPTSSTTSTEPPTTASPTSQPPTTAAPPPAPSFEATVSPILDADRARMTASWRPGCPVPLDDLRLVVVDHWGYDGAEHRGELVVHADHSDGIVRVFAALFDAHYPIERLQLIDAYGGDDHESTLANNTAAFNCRAVVGSPGSWSEHAFGRAIDVNPRVNPYTLDPRVTHPALAPYLDRSRSDQGMIRAGDAVVASFASIGWQWGGTWLSPDYQHFSSTGH